MALLFLLQSVLWVVVLSPLSLRASCLFLDKDTVQQIGSLRAVHDGKDDLDVDAGAGCAGGADRRCSGETVEEILGAQYAFSNGTVAQIAVLRLAASGTHSQRTVEQFVDVAVPRDPRRGRRT